MPPIAQELDSAFKQGPGSIGSPVPGSMTPEPVRAPAALPNFGAGMKQPAPMPTTPPPTQEQTPIEQPSEQPSLPNFAKGLPNFASGFGGVPTSKIKQNEDGSFTYESGGKQKTMSKFESDFYRGTKATIESLVKGGLMGAGFVAGGAAGSVASPVVGSAVGAVAFGTYAGVKADELIQHVENALFGDDEINKTILGMAKDPKKSTALQAYTKNAVEATLGILIPHAAQSFLSGQATQFAEKSAASMASADTLAKIAGIQDAAKNKFGVDLTNEQVARGLPGDAERAAQVQAVASNNPAAYQQYLQEQKTQINNAISDVTKNVYDLGQPLAKQNAQVMSSGKSIYEVRQDAYRKVYKNLSGKIQEMAGDRPLFKESSDITNLFENKVQEKFGHLIKDGSINPQDLMKLLNDKSSIAAFAESYRDLKNITNGPRNPKFSQEFDPLKTGQQELPYNSAGPSTRGPTVGQIDSFIKSVGDMANFGAKERSHGELMLGDIYHDMIGIRNNMYQDIAMNPRGGVADPAFAERVANLNARFTKETDSLRSLDKIITEKPVSTAKALVENTNKKQFDAALSVMSPAVRARVGAEYLNEVTSQALDELANGSIQTIGANDLYKKLFNSNRTPFIEEILGKHASSMKELLNYARMAEVSSSPVVAQKAGNGIIKNLLKIQGVVNVDHIETLLSTALDGNMTVKNMVSARMKDLATSTAKRASRQSDLSGLAADLSTLSGYAGKAAVPMYEYSQRTKEQERNK